MIATSTEPRLRRFTREEYYRLKEAGFFEPHTVELIGGEIWRRHPPPGVPICRRWTREEYHHMAELGLFEGQRVELIGGEIFVMSPQNFRHGRGGERIARILERAFGEKFWVRTQQPLYLGLDSDPEPDVYVVDGDSEDFTDHPTSAVLVVEVSDSTLETDVSRKASLYACAGIKDYWVVNLRRDQLEVRRKPVADAAQPFGFRYLEETFFSLEDHVSPLAKRDAKISVKRLLPPHFDKKKD